ncbi:fas-associated death domain protein [Zootermopsis nevadensis]|uniref:Death domain-containing adapter protein BG4 n=1 Tax=Zootermopsis nevadensis TaxID=136037 RepID=A0A067QNS8_ZOONE|nr:fas-associated death domain protein [Zootermopsis nevadensis]KDR11191.1 Death domain-containing adapter protein BG4 [Zootermopsis nevadensis]
MSAFAAEYMELRGQIVNHSEKYLRKTHLKILIDKFQPIINSKRLSSYVNNFNDLITILEKRSYVGEHNVGPFTEIVQLLPNADILSEMLSNFQTNNNRNRIQGMHMNNNGSTEPPFYSSSNSSGSRSRSADIFFSNNSVLQKAALDHICKDIGTQWRELARNLSIREGEIDDIEVQYPRNLKERAYECMKRFIQETEPYKVQQKLLYALDKCGRRDLKEDVEEILNRRAY